MNESYLPISMHLNDKLCCSGSSQRIVFDIEFLGKMIDYVSSSLRHTYNLLLLFSLWELSPSSGTVREHILKRRGMKFLALTVMSWWGCVYFLWEKEMHKELIKVSLSESKNCNCFCYPHDSTITTSHYPFLDRSITTIAITDVSIDIWHQMQHRWQVWRWGAELYSSLNKSSNIPQRHIYWPTDINLEWRTCFDHE